MPSDTAAATRLDIRLTPEEAATIDARVEWLGLSRTDYARLALGLASATTTIGALEQHPDTPDGPARRRQAVDDVRAITRRLTGRREPLA